MWRLLLVGAGSGNFSEPSRTASRKQRATPLLATRGPGEELANQVPVWYYAFTFMYSMLCVTSCEALRFKEQMGKDYFDYYCYYYCFGASTSSNHGTFVSRCDDFKRCTGVLDRGLHRKRDPWKVLCSLTADSQWRMTKRKSWAGMCGGNTLVMLPAPVERDNYNRTWC